MNSSVIVHVDNEAGELVNEAIEAQLINAVNKTFARFALIEELADEGVIAQVSILLSDRESMKALNSEYMGRDEVTDVLSFPFLSLTDGVLRGEINDWDVEIVDDKKLVHLGDIVICPEVAAEQSTKSAKQTDKQAANLATKQSDKLAANLATKQSDIQVAKQAVEQPVNLATKQADKQATNLAAKGAIKQGRSLQDEMLMLTVHGSLHLLGFDHGEEAEEARMFSLQESILRDLTLPEAEDSPEDFTESFPSGLSDDFLMDFSQDSIDANNLTGLESDSPDSVDLAEDFPASFAADTTDTFAEDFIGDFPEDFKAGYVTIIGRPNVGKSTLLNYLIGTKIAIISPKPQTTQKMIRGVYSDEEAQIVLLDTPGIHQPSDKLGRLMLKAAEQALLEADVVCLMIEAGFKPFVDTIEHRLLKKAEELDKPVIIILNKTDIASKEGMLPLIDIYNQNYKITAFVPISAKSGEGVEILISEIKRVLPFSEPLYTEENYSDQTEKMLAAELIRESILYRLQEEVPYGVAVIIESFDEDYDAAGSRTRAQIDAIVLTERESHKRILLGKGGNMIKHIGINSREKIEEMLGCPVDLSLFVKVRADWRNKSHHLRELDFESRDFS
ncbi:MAG TPA: GTPase Era [Clostridiaceae bacterium]|nr:GTPase Era [Clostridiaceae bacterium]